MVQRLVLLSTMGAVGYALAALPQFTAKMGQDRNAMHQNVKQLNLGCLMYAADYDDVFPSARSTTGVKPQLLPYTRNPGLWKSTNPSGSVVVFNTKLAGVPVPKVTYPATTPIIFESKPWPDGGRVVGYTDGHAKIETPVKWRSVQRFLYHPVEGPAR